MLKSFCCREFKAARVAVLTEHQMQSRVVLQRDALDARNACNMGEENDFAALRLMVPAGILLPEGHRVQVWVNKFERALGGGQSGTLM